MNHHETPDEIRGGLEQLEADFTMLKVWQTNGECPHLTTAEDATSARTCTTHANNSPLEIAVKFIVAVIIATTLLAACSAQPAQHPGAAVPAVAHTDTPAPTGTPAAEAELTKAPASTTSPTLAPSSTPPLPSPTPPTPSPAPTPTAIHTSQPALLRVTVSEVPANLPQYERRDWKHWTDADGDCQVSRDEVLAAESREPVSYLTDEECRVASGQWLTPYSNSVVTDPSELDIDHMVPLGNAHRSGGWEWSAERREQYANYLGDPQHLIAVTTSVNRSKGARGPEEWKPEDESRWCRYAVDWIMIKDTWDLTVTQAEHDALVQMLNTCPDDTRLMAEHQDQIAPALVSAETPVPPTMAPFGPTPQATAVGEAACPTDRAALVALYKAMDGDGWRSKDNWLSDSPIESWEGVEVNAGGCVTDLRLVRNNLYGSIPAEMGDLASLNHLDLTGNLIYGPIPPEMGRLQSLNHLELGQNGLKGSIPVELSALQNLDDLNLAANRLDGPIPPELGQLANLSILHLGLNELSGPIPPELAGLASLEILNLGDNEISGDIPPELGRLSGLKVLHLDFNQLTGPIPPELGRLGNLNHLTLGFNQLSGQIPAGLGELVNLHLLDLGPNALTGPIPPELENLSNLIELDLGENSLEGEIPGWIGSLSELKNIHLYKNRFTGTIPDTVGGLTKLENLVLSDNRIGGPIPGSLGNLTQLRWLGLNSNQLSGAIPDELGNLTRLERLWLNDNRLNGEIPAKLGNLTALDALFLSGNNFTGCLPPGLPQVPSGDLHLLALPYCQ